jgi:hypothetical protein
MTAYTEVDEFSPTAGRKESIPQGLKPTSFQEFSGTTQVVPFYKSLNRSSHRHPVNYWLVNSAFASGAEAKARKKRNMLY